jgi:hypothetical protein
MDASPPSTAPTRRAEAVAIANGAFAEAAKRKEGQYRARVLDPTDHSGSTLSQDIDACWAAFWRRTGGR